MERAVSDMREGVPDAGSLATHLGPAAAPKAIALRSAEFRRGREDAWRRLEDMVDRAERSGIGALTAEEVQMLPLLYRAAVSSLSVARYIVLDRNLLLYLENLALRAYFVVYGPRAGMLESLGNFFRRGFPQAVRAIRRHLAVAALLFFAAAIAGYVLVQADINNYHLLMPDGLSQGRTPESTREELSDILFSPWPGFMEMFVAFANALFQHNTMVGILCFSLGFAVGIPTSLALSFNGLTLGAFVSLHASRGLGTACVAWLSIHGVTEILAILLCGAAGLLIAEKILFPGERTRVDSLMFYGRKAAHVVGGTVALFFIAGIIEGGFRQLINNTGGRFAFASATAMLWVLYFGFAGREGGRRGDTH
jgi:Uncharacterized membrane protein